jgi:uncharacterized LabA/DUF88 family protein
MNKKINSRVKNDLTKKLADIIKDKKVMVQVDAANIYFAAQQKNWNVDFKNIATWFKANSLQTDLVYYTAFDIEDEKQTQYLLDMAENQYRVFKKPLKIFDDETRKGNLDVEIGIDAMMNIFNFEIFVLLSGDGDFTYLVQTLESLGKKVIIIGIAGFMSYELHSQAGNFFFFDRIKDVWQKPKTDKKPLLDLKNVISSAVLKVQEMFPKFVGINDQQVKTVTAKKESANSTNPNSYEPKKMEYSVDTKKEAQFLSANNLPPKQIEKKAQTKNTSQSSIINSSSKPQAKPLPPKKFDSPVATRRVFSANKQKPDFSDQKVQPKYSLNTIKTEETASKSNLNSVQIKPQNNRIQTQKYPKNQPKPNLDTTPKKYQKPTQPKPARSVPTIVLE